MALSSSAVEKAGQDGHRVALTLREYRFLSPPITQNLLTTSELPTEESCSPAKDVTSWSLPEDTNKPAFTTMEPVPNVDQKISDVNGEDEVCPVPDMQCMAMAETGNYGEQLLPDQLLSFPMQDMSKCQTEEKRETNKRETESEQTAKNMYEGLLLERCNGEDGVLSSSNQDWGYIESIISESKMELLDLCSKNELSVNLFSAEDVDNYMFDDDDDDSSALGSDMCSLKIRYESFQDNMREKTNVLHEDTQLNFFPTFLVNCTKIEGSVVKKSADGLLGKPEELAVGHESGGSVEDNDSSSERTTEYSPNVNFFIDSNNSSDDSEQESDDSCGSGSSFDALQKGKHKNSLKILGKNFCPSSTLSYDLRAKRKVRFSDDYLYDVDSIEGEKQLSSALKDEVDDEWCPTKRRKSCRRELPVTTKYVIVNRFKGDRHMTIKLGRIDPALPTISLNQDMISKYKKLAPMKEFWKQEQLRLATENKCNFPSNGHHRLFGCSPAKRKFRLTKRLRIQRIQTVAQTQFHKQGSSLFESRQQDGSKENESPTGMPLNIAATSCAGTLAPNGIIHTVTRKSRTQEMEERRRANQTLKMRKFKSEARLKFEQMKRFELNRVKTKDQDDGIDAANTSEAAEKNSFSSTTCFPAKPSSGENVVSRMPVIPGGYLQTLLDGSDSVGGSNISFFPPQTSRENSLSLSLEEQQFVSLQLAQSCVLSPPSESELQQSPPDCPSLTQMWPSQHNPNQQFSPGTQFPPNNFSSALPMQLPENVVQSIPGYSQLGLDSNRVLYEKNYMPERASLPTEAQFQACQGLCMEGQLAFQRGALHSDNGRLISFDSAGSLSGTSTNYSSLSLKSCEKNMEDDVNENYLAHCSPKIMIQQSMETITPLRESTDLLDISNFTPDKFRHASLSAELSPPETPNLSPQVTGREMKTVGNATLLSNGEVSLESGQEIKWNHSLVEQQHIAGYSVDTHLYQVQALSNEETLNREKMEVDDADLLKGSKSKRKGSNKQTATQGAKKSKSTKPKAPKGEKVKVPRQNSRASKKLKALLDEKSVSSQMGDSKQPADGSCEDWQGIGCAETNRQTDDQREFEEPSNILSNIVSGMAEVQRFMMASIEPVWGPAPNVYLPSEANSLSLKTLKILAGTASDPKKKGGTSLGGAKARKVGGKSGKNQAKLSPLFPPLPLGCNIFDKCNLGIPGLNGPAHKKMYRHKTSAKFPRMESVKGKRAEPQDPNKDIALMTSFEKLR